MEDATELTGVCGTTPDTDHHHHDACGCEHDHEHGHGQACDHEHSHEHGCSCGHDHQHAHQHAHQHDHEHQHDHDHECGDGCSCGHDHQHDHGHGHNHGHDHDACGCSCEHEHDYDHEACGCSCEHEHDYDHEACGCSCDHEHNHDQCGCSCDHEHNHDQCGCCCGHDHAPLEERELEGSPSFVLHVLDVDCPSCARNIQNAVRTLEGVSDARLVYATQTLEVVAGPGVSERDLKRSVLECVRSCGSDLELTEAERTELEAERSWFQEHRERVLMGISGMMLVAGLVAEHLMGNESRAIPLYVIAAVSGLVFIAPMALSSLRRRTADMNVLMSIAVLGALIMGFLGDDSVFGDAALVIFLDQVGEWLEGWSMRKTSGSIAELMELAPRVAHVLAPDGTTIDVQTAGVDVGYTIRVLPGERVPLDGTIVSGESAFMEAAVTGESMPRDKGEGAEVYAGTLNTTSVVDVRVTADDDCSTLARIVSEVKGAQAAKAPYESFVTRFAERYTPVVVAGAAFLGLVVPLALSIASGSLEPSVWHDWFYRACSLLVVACPCALVISTPVTFVSALTRAAHMGVLVKGGAYFDLARSIDVVAFDKTGTLTSGSPRVSSVWAVPGADETEVLRIAAALEVGSTHPLARAIVAEAATCGLEVPAAVDTQEVSASGMRGIVLGQACTVGKPTLAVADGAVASEVASTIAEMGAGGASTVTVSRAGQILGVIAVSDTLRESTPSAVAALSNERDVWMLTGDNERAAGTIAERAGITHVAAELLPEDKLDRIRELQQAGHAVCMVGDGINDAPALAVSDLGVTMGAAASDTALEVADVALLSDALEQLPAFFALARKTMRVVRENIAFAIGVKVVVFVAVAAGLAGMGAAVFADTGVALLVVLNGMRLMRASRLPW